MRAHIRPRILPRAFQRVSKTTRAAINEDSRMRASVWWTREARRTWSPFTADYCRMRAREEFKIEMQLLIPLSVRYTARQIVRPFKKLWELLEGFMSARIE